MVYIASPTAIVSKQARSFMNSANPPKVAVIADAHFHDLYGDYDFAGIATKNGNMTARRLWDSARSTRVFNESYFALRAALDEVFRRDIRHVVLLGDYSDDGQRSTLKALEGLLDEYRNNHGLVFTATVGNHDIFGPDGRHHGKRLLNADGTYSFVASTDSFIDEDTTGFVLTEKMYCDGYPAGLQHIHDLGFFQRRGDLYWETPFGTNDAPTSRLYNVISPDGLNSYDLMDGSYLVEPEPDLWFLMIDANVFAPRNGAFQKGHASAFEDSTNAGWNALMQHKSFILAWMQDVAQRAEEQGKRLLTFSHYPVVDMLNGTGPDEQLLLGQTAAVKRIPLAETSKAVMKTGVGVHFSGHLHVNDTARFSDENGWLVNVGVPSLVAFPPAFKIVTIGDGQMEIETVLIDDMALDVTLNEQYRKESAVTGRNLSGLLNAENYGQFISEHVAQLVISRYLRKSWPEDMARAFKHLKVVDLVTLYSIKKTINFSLLKDISIELDQENKLQAFHAFCADQSIDAESLQHLSMIDLLSDWYRLRKASELAVDWIVPERMALYRALISLYKDVNFESDSPQAKLAIILRMMGRYMEGLPSDHFQINLKTGMVTPVRGNSQQ